MLEYLKYSMQGRPERVINILGVKRIFTMFARGIFASLILRRLVFIGKSGVLENFKCISGEGILKLEENVLVQGVSSRGVRLGRGVSFGAFSQLRPSSQYGGLVGEGCSIGDGTTFGPFAYIGCAGFIEIGERCMFGPRVTLIAENHLIPELGRVIKGDGVTRLGIRIGDDCWVGANAVILDGVNIGRGSVVGAGAVVLHDIPEYSIAVGVPAKVVRKR